MSHYYDLDGKPITDMDWVRIREERGGNHVAKTTVDYGGDTIDVSTVWLGMDHQFGDGPPLIFETMVFGGPKGLDCWCDRYPTQEAAQAGHDRIVAALKARNLTMFGIDPDDIPQPVLSEAVLTAGHGDLWAVEWLPHEDRAGGREIMTDWDDAGRDAAEHLLAHYASWPGRLLRRRIVVGAWLAVEPRFVSTP